LFVCLFFLFSNFLSNTHNSAQVFTGEEIPQMLVIIYTSTACPVSTYLLLNNNMRKKRISIQFCFKSFCSTQIPVFTKYKLEKFSCSVRFIWNLPMNSGTPTDLCSQVSPVQNKNTLKKKKKNPKPRKPQTHGKNFTSLSRTEFGQN